MSNKVGQYWKGKKREYIPHPKMKGLLANANNPQWKGDDVGYFALHKWIRRNYGSARNCNNFIRCTGNAKKFEWASISGKYKRDIKDWIQLCHSCHRRYDFGSIAITT